MTDQNPDEKAASRLDNRMVSLGLAPTRAKARDAILRGHVTVDGRKAEKPAQSVRSEAAIEVDDPAGDYVSRAALKLVAALDHFGYSPDGLAALDLGASTGGFTEVLLRRGARRVFGVDVGHGQLHRRIAEDPRVVNLEGLNARDLKPARITEKVSAITADVSFISLRLALPPALSLAATPAWGVFLIKPQFEVGREGVGKGGVVRDLALGRSAADGIAAWIEKDKGWTVDGLIDSPIEGGDGNREYLIGVRRG
jgi:23S rRNA (cytidine1920-2'-O)/16S rRNA (cytidine1409-2'-O)-methyltransferase